MLLAGAEALVVVSIGRGTVGLRGLARMLAQEQGGAKGLGGSRGRGPRGGPAERCGWSAMPSNGARLYNRPSCSGTRRYRGRAAARLTLGPSTPWPLGPCENMADYGIVLPLWDYAANPRLARPRRRRGRLEPRRRARRYRPRSARFACTWSSPSRISTPTAAGIFRRRRKRTPPAACGR